MDDWKLKTRPVVRLERPKKKFVLNINIFTSLQVSRVMLCIYAKLVRSIELNISTTYTPRFADTGVGLCLFTLSNVCTQMTSGYSKCSCTCIEMVYD